MLVNMYWNTSFCFRIRKLQLSSWFNIRSVPRVVCTKTPRHGDSSASHSCCGIFNPTLKSSSCSTKMQLWLSSLLPFASWTDFACTWDLPLGVALWSINPNFQVNVLRLAIWLLLAFAFLMDETVLPGQRKMLEICSIVTV